MRIRGPIGTGAALAESGGSRRFPIIFIVTACLAASSRRPLAGASLWRRILAILKTRTIEEQRRNIRTPACAARRQSLRALAGAPAGDPLWPGIPPSQYRALAGDSPDGIAGRAEAARRTAGLRLSPIQTNYFAWRRSGGAMRRAPTRRCRPICSATILRICASAPIACACIIVR